MRPFKFLISAIVATSLVLSAFPANALVGSWSTPVELIGTEEGVSSPQITVDSTGLATAVWQRTLYRNIVVQSSTSQSGGDWSDPEILSSTAEDAYEPQLTVDPMGVVTAIWKSFNGTDTIIKSSTKPHGGSWSEPVSLSPGGNPSQSPQVVVDSTGLVTAVWSRDNGNDFIIQSRTLQRGGSWSPAIGTAPEEISRNGGTGRDPQLAVDSTGLVTAIWEWVGANGSVIQSSTRPRGGNWSTIPTDLTDGNSLDASDPQVTVDSTGLVTAVWFRWNGTRDVIESRTRQNGGAWSTLTDDVSTGGGNSQQPQVTVDQTGLVTAIWQYYDGNNYSIQSSSRPSGGLWSTPVSLSPAGEYFFDPQITVDTTGFLTAIWYNDDDSLIQSSFSQSGAAWSPTVSLSRGSFPQVTVDSTGLVTAIWTRSNNGSSYIQSSTFANPIPPAPPSLAKTGVEVDWLALASLIAFVTGAGLFALGRGRRTE